MNQDLQKLIDIAKDGDAITPKQREIILKKAQELGEDLDEVEMVLESIQSKHIAKESTKKNEERRKCPNCGATIADSALTCSECGYTLQQENKASIEARAAIDKLQEKLTAAATPRSAISSMFDPMSQYRAQASIVSAFTMPTTKEGLTSFLEFAYSNYASFGNGVDDMYSKPLKNAWYSKTMQAYNSLARLGVGDSETKKLLEKYSSLISTEKKKLSGYTKLMLFCLLFFIPLCIVVPYFGIKGENAERAQEEVKTCLQNNDFVGAKAAARNAPNSSILLDDISIQEVLSLIEQDNYEQARIIASGIEDKEKKEIVLTSIENAEKRSLGNN